MNVIDSSAWLEYFAAGENAGFFAAAIENSAELIVPTLSLYEVSKKILQQRTETDAPQAIAVMQQGRPVDLDPRIALGATRAIHGPRSVNRSMPGAASGLTAAHRASTGPRVSTVRR